MSSQRHVLTEEGERYLSPLRRLEFLPLDPPPPGALVEIADGVQWLRVPLPMELNHINLWLLEGAAGWTLVDTGMDAEPCRAAWDALAAGPLAGRRIERIVVTHAHPDHVGLASWLAARFAAPVSMSRAAHQSLTAQLAREPEAVRERVLGFLHAHGLADAADAPGLARPSHRRWQGPPPDLDLPLGDGEALPLAGEEWCAIEAGGHAVGHLCLHAPGRRLLVAGDQVLPTISPNVSVMPGAPRANPLREYLDSLERIAGCGEQTLVLPSHGRPFHGLVRRCTDLRRHHLQQLERLRDLCREPRTAGDLLPHMFGRALRGLHRLLGLGEALAHLHCLEADGELERQVDAGGVVRFLVT